ncbi:conserved protein [Tepidicaulis marinus]|uniref:Conserved protein n=1 Tax=Tepidicaulis marinus TaxID=1333998 RepID=A0A081BCU4_9HYPH|nr:hypothetical protein [Tepidicaulis marinus]GAK45862.1 conserved protein [Tepidicaulis marinus]
MEKIVSGLLILTGLLNAAPVMGVFGAARLKTMYGLSFEEPNLLVLMQHRAVLFALIGGFMIFAAFKPALQPAAFLIGFVSMAAFVWLAWGVPELNGQLKRVMIADIAGIGALLAAIAIYFLARPQI